MLMRHSTKSNSGDQSIRRNRSGYICDTIQGIYNWMRSDILSINRSPVWLPFQFDDRINMRPKIHPHSQSAGTIVPPFLFKSNINKEYLGEVIWGQKYANDRHVTPTDSGNFINIIRYKPKLWLCPAHFYHPS